MKKYLFGTLAVVIAVGISSFTTKKASRPFTTATYYYKSTNSQTTAPFYFRVDASINTGSTYVRSIDQTASKFLIGNLSNPDCPWTTSSWSFSPTATGTRYVGSIEFNEDFLSNNENDGAITLQEAVNKLMADFVANGNSLASGTHFVDSNNDGIGVNVTVLSATSVRP